MQGSITLGISLPVSAGDASLDVEGIIRLAAHADDLGFGTLSCGDHLLWNTPILDPFVTLGMVAGATTRASLMTGLAIAPLRHPYWTAKMANTLSHLSAGRFVLGLGVGGEVLEEFDALTVDRRHRGSLTNRAVEVAAGLLKPGVEPRIGSSDLVMGPALDARVPIWLAGRNASALRRVARSADGWLGLFLSPRRYSEVRDELQELVRAEPDRVNPLAYGMQLFVCVDESEARGRSRATSFVSTHFGGFDERIMSHVVVGSRYHVAAVVRDYISRGATFVQFHLIGGEYEASLEMIALELEELLPSVPLHQSGSIK